MVKQGVKVQQRIHAYVCPELQLLAEDLGQAEKWATTSGLSALWGEGYIGEKGGKDGGVGICADSSVGLEKHKATGGAKLDVGHLVVGTYMLCYRVASTYVASISGWMVVSWWIMHTLCHASRGLLEEARVRGWWEGLEQRQRMLTVLR